MQYIANIYIQLDRLIKIISFSKVEYWNTQTQIV